MAALNLYSIAGVVYDIAGAILLAEAIALTSDKTLVQQSQYRQFSGGNLELFRALAEQRHDARFGLGLLVAGFSLQLFGPLGYALTIGWLSGLLLTGLLMAVLVWWRIAAKRLAVTAGTRFAACLGGMDLANFLRLHPDVPHPADVAKSILRSR